MTKSLQSKGDIKVEKNSKQDAGQLVGICGLYCGTCPIYLAQRENDIKQLNEISQVRSIPLDKIRCDGCLSDRVFSLCIECSHGFRQCAREKQVTWCFQCNEFPCRRLTIFKDVHIVDGISHHAHVIEDLQYMKDHGIEQWVKEQEKAGLCPRCGERLYWFARECPKCHTPVR
jgi:hypothetical protein